MESVEEIFSKYGSYLENEQLIKDGISSQTKSLDKISNNISVILEKLHNGVDDVNIAETCSCIRLELKKAMEAYSNLQTVVPHDQFYRYNGLFKMSTQRLVMATALLIYLSENRLVRFEEAASILGLKIFSPEDPLSSKLNEAEMKDQNNSEAMNFSDVQQARNEIPNKCEDNAETLEDIGNKSDASEPYNVHPPPDAPVREDLQPVVQLSTSTKGTELVLAPPSPRLVGESCVDHESSLTHARKSAQAFSVDAVESKDDCCLSTLTLADDEFQSMQRKAGSFSALYLDLEDFLIGTLKIGSELARLSVNAVACGNFSLPYRVNKFLRELHAGYTLLHLRNSYLRKTYDELKYSLKKTEDVVYNLSVRGLKPPSK
ncbi:Translin family [Trinorchestia longiramus]|nr:Translin family [Trinorchestia longiramus]